MTKTFAVDVELLAKLGGGNTLPDIMSITVVAPDGATARRIALASAKAQFIDRCGLAANVAIHHTIDIKEVVPKTTF